MTPTAINSNQLVTRAYFDKTLKKQFLYYNGLVADEFLKIHGRIDGLQTELRKFKEEMTEFKQEMLEFKTEMVEFKDEMTEFKEDMLEFKQDMMEFKQEMTEFKEDMLEFKKEAKGVLYQILNEIRNMREDIKSISLQVSQHGDRLTSLEYRVNNTGLRLADKKR